MNPRLCAGLSMIVVDLCCYDGTDPPRSWNPAAGDGGTGGALPDLVGSGDCRAGGADEDGLGDGEVGVGVGDGEDDPVGSGVGVGDGDGRGDLVGDGLGAAGGGLAGADATGGRVGVPVWEEPVAGRIRSGTGRVGPRPIACGCGPGRNWIDTETSSR